MTHRLVLLALSLLALTLTAATPARPTAQFAPGTVVQLQATPHLWFADEHGVLHWGGDTRALAGRHIDWHNRATVSLERLRSLPRGDPWLSAGLLKDGDPIYLVKWETEWARPQLFHIRSIGDVELFGINGSNYGRFVIERGAWEQRFGISVADLQRHVLAGTTVPGRTRENPAPIGTAVDLADGWRITVLSVTPNANKRIAEHAYSYQGPKEEHQFFIARLAIVRIGEGSAERPSGMKAVGGSNVAYSSYCRNSLPDELRYPEVFPGGSVEGNICFEVRSTDVGSLVMFYDPRSRQGGTIYRHPADRRYFALTH